MAMDRAARLSPVETPAPHAVRPRVLRLWRRPGSKATRWCEAQCHRCAGKRMPPFVFSRRRDQLEARGLRRALGGPASWG
eukprot:8341520-Alexandrium_andersonii.AAC.1